MTDTTETTDRGRGLDPVWARVRPLVFRTMIGAVVAAGLVGIIAVLVGDFGLVAVQLLLTIVVIVVFALLSWYDADVSSRRSGAFAFASVLTSMYLLVAGLVKVWIVQPGPYGGAGLYEVGVQFWQWVGLVAIARAALLHVHLLLVIHRRYPTPALQLVAKGTVAVIALLAVLLSLPVVAAHAHFADGYWRLVWVIAILDLLGTVVIPLSNALFRPRGAESEPHGVGTRGPWGATGVVLAPPGLPSEPWAGHARPADPTAQGVVGAAGPVPDAWSAIPVVGDRPFVDQRGATLPERGTRSASGADPAVARAVTVRSVGPDAETVVGTDGHVYERRPAAGRTLAWPRYADGTPLPALADGSPDFSGVARR